MNSKELDAIHAAMVVLRDHGHKDASAALATILVQEAPRGWWSE